MLIINFFNFVDGLALTLPSVQLLVLSSLTTTFVFLSSEHHNCFFFLSYFTLILLSLFLQFSLILTPSRDFSFSIFTRCRAWCLQSSQYIILSRCHGVSCLRICQFRTFTTDVPYRITLYHHVFCICCLFYIQLFLNACSWSPNISAAISIFKQLLLIYIHALYLSWRLYLLQTNHAIFLPYFPIWGCGVHSSFITQCSILMTQSLFVLTVLFFQCQNCPT